MLYRLFFCCVFYIAFINTVHPQPKQEDSLLTLIKKHPEKDTMRVKRLLDYVGKKFLTIPDSTMLQYSDEALQISQDIGWPKGIAMAYQRKGIVYLYIFSDFLNALNSFQASIKANEDAKLPNFTGQMYSNIGIVFQNNKLFRKALNYYLSGYREAIKDKWSNKDLLKLDLNIGNAYGELKMMDSALFYYDKAMALIDESTGPMEKGLLFSATGYCYSQTNEFDKAKRYLQQGLDQSRQINFTLGTGLALNNLSQLYLKMNDAVKAEQNAKEALALTEQFPAATWTATALQTLSSSYKMQGKYKEAYETLNRSFLLFDSTLNEATDEKLAFQEAQFEYDKKEAVLNTEHKAELKQQQTIRNFLIAGAALIVLAAVLLFFSYKRRRDAIAKKNDAELKAQITDTELKVMRLQMNPHFIFNSLNSISDYIAKNNPKEADDYLSKFAKVMRMTLENSEQQAIPLNDDLKALDLYMQLEAKRLNNKFTYEIKVGDDIDKENTLVPPMIFQPFVENSIWHGIAKKEGKGHIIIDIRKEGEMLNCRIDDDGIGRKEAESLKVNQEDKKQSLGMKITKARIEILNKLKGSNATVQLVDKLQGVTAELKLPVEMNF